MYDLQITIYNLQFVGFKSWLHLIICFPIQPTERSDVQFAGLINNQPNEVSFPLKNQAI